MQKNVFNIVIVSIPVAMFNIFCSAISPPICDKSYSFKWNKGEKKERRRTGVSRIPLVVAFRVKSNLIN